MYWVVQEDTFREKHYKTLLRTLERFDFEYEIVKFRPFVPAIGLSRGKKVRSVKFKTKRKDVFPWGAVMMAQASRTYGWYPGSQMNDNHDVEVYGKYYDLLNADGKVIGLDEEIPFDNFIFFARPTADTKAFTGSVFTKDAWYEWVGELMTKLYDLNRPDYTLMDHFMRQGVKAFVAPVKEIYQEIRCWVVGGRVVTISQYKIGNRVVYENLDHDQEAIDYAQSQVDKYQPAEAFVIDICRTEDGFRVVEVNSINCAGFYEVNMQKLIMALMDHFGRRSRWMLGKTRAMWKRMKKQSATQNQKFRKDIKGLDKFLKEHFNEQRLREAVA